VAQARNSVAQPTRRIALPREHTCAAQLPPCDQLGDTNIKRTWAGLRRSNAQQMTRARLLASSYTQLNFTIAGAHFVMRRAQYLGAADTALVLWLSMARCWRKG
jgi:hypothetical protein